MCLKHDFYEVLLKFLPPEWITWKTDTYNLGQFLQYSLYYVVGGYLLKLLGNHPTLREPTYCRTPKLLPPTILFFDPEKSCVFVEPLRWFSNT